MLNAQDVANPNTSVCTEGCPVDVLNVKIPSSDSNAQNVVESLPSNTKVCGICKIEKSVTEFYNKSRLKNVKRYRCKKCEKMYQKTRYNKNVKFCEDYLKNNPCLDCGETDFIVLEFDHINGKKEYDMSRLFTGKYSMKIIMKEIEKCEVRCANCHRRRHYYERLRKEDNGTATTASNE